MDSQKYVNFNYESKEARERTISALFYEAKNAREEVGVKWRTNDELYSSFKETLRRFEEKSGEELSKTYKLNDPFVQVESQINPEVPEVVFRGRDNNLDSAKAKQREYIVKYLLYANDIKAQNTKVERARKKYGDAFYKVFWNAEKNYADDRKGDIEIKAINVDDIFPDPAADSLQDCEYIDYVYYMHRAKAARVFKDDLKKAQLDIWSLITENESATKEVTDIDNTARNMHSVQILEHWYRDTEGDIALSILINEKEIRNIEKYWVNTRNQNKLFPFIHFWNIRADKGLWNISDLDVIAPLVEVENKMLNAGLLNMEYMSNDVWLIEKQNDDDGMDDDEINNQPGGIIRYKTGQRAPQRAGGLASMEKFWSSISQIEDRIQKTLRNYDLNMGSEPTRVQTASGIAQLRADQAKQTNKKDFDLWQSWKRLFVLVDWSALEFYDDDRLIYIGTPQRRGKSIEYSKQENLDENQGDIFFRFDSRTLREEMTDDGIETESYYPTVDCEVSPTDSTEKNQIISNLLQIANIQTNVTNYKIIVMAVEQLNIPQKQEIIDQILDIYEPQAPEGMSEEEQAAFSRLLPEQRALFKGDPSLTEIAKQTAQNELINAGIA